MNSIEPSWELYRSFLAVLREGSLSGAARALELTQPTIGRHIDALERSLRASLFTRAQNGLSPTDAALELQPYAESMEASSRALLRAVASSRDEIRGTVRITASEIIGAEVLPPILADLQRDHPQLVVELVLSNRTEDLLRREADIAVRMVRPQQQALAADLEQERADADASRLGCDARKSSIKCFNLLLIGDNRETARKEIVASVTVGHIHHGKRLSKLGNGLIQNHLHLKNPFYPPTFCGRTRLYLRMPTPKVKAFRLKSRSTPNHPIRPFPIS